MFWNSLEWFLRESYKNWKRAFCRILPRKVKVVDMKGQLLWEASCNNWVWARPLTPPFPSNFSEQKNQIVLHVPPGRKKKILTTQFVRVVCSLTQSWQCFFACVVWTSSEPALRLATRTLGLHVCWFLVVVHPISHTQLGVHMPVANPNGPVFCGLKHVETCWNMLKPLTRGFSKGVPNQQRHLPGESWPCLQRSRGGGGRGRGTSHQKFVPDDGGTTSSSLGEIEFLVERERLEDKTDHILYTYIYIYTYKGFGLIWD